MAYIYYPPTGDSNKNGSPKKPQNDGGYWFMMIFFLIIGAWPVSIIMLLLKVISDKKIDRTYDKVTQRHTAAQTGEEPSKKAARQPKRAENTVLRQPKKGSRALMILGVIAMLVGALLCFEPVQGMLTWGYIGYYLQDLLRAAGFILCGGVAYTAGRGLKRKEARRSQYLNAIADQRIVQVKMLASIAGVSVHKAYAELEDMIADELLPKGAFLDRSRQCLVLDPAAMPYEQEFAAEMQASAKAGTEAAADTEESEPVGEYDKILQEIRQANLDIEDEEMSCKIDHIETVARSIFSIVREKPERRQEIRSFFNYYLPTTQKLLNFYAQLEEQPVQSQTIRDSRRNIEGIMDNLVKGFENQLDSLFKADALDISSDISVLENMLAQDGLRPTDAEQAMANAARKKASKAPGPAKTAPASSVGYTDELSENGGTAAATFPQES